MAWSWKDVGNTIAGVAPTIAGVVGNIFLPGAGGPLAAMGVKALLEALGLGDKDPEDPATIDAVQAAVMGGNPETLLALKKADQDFASKMKELDIDLERVYADDRDSARKREMEVKDNTPAVLAYVTVTAFLATVATILATAIAGLLELGPVAAGLVGTITGGVIAKTGDVFAYYYGTTRSSKQKDDTITDLTRPKGADS